MSLFYLPVLLNIISREEHPGIPNPFIENFKFLPMPKKKDITLHVILLFQLKHIKYNIVVEYIPGKYFKKKHKPIVSTMYMTIHTEVNMMYPGIIIRNISYQ